MCARDNHKSTADRVRACKLQPGSCMHAHSACGAERHEAVGANRIANRTAAAWFGPRSRSSLHLHERMARTPVRTCSPPNSSKHRGPGQKSAATCSVFHGNPRPRRRLLCSAVRVYPLYHTYAGRVPAPHCIIITIAERGREASLSCWQRNEQSGASPAPATRGSPSVSPRRRRTTRFLPNPGAPPCCSACFISFLPPPPSLD